MTDDTQRKTPASVLVVEDEPDLRASMAEYLTLQGFRVNMAADGAAMRDSMAVERPDILLLDLRLPGEDGLSLLRGLRTAGGPPVIMVTALGDPIDRIVGLEMGADDYVVKPFEFRELLARMRSVLRRTGQDSPGQNGMGQGGMGQGGMGQDSRKGSPVARPVTPATRCAQVARRTLPPPGMTEDSADRPRGKVAIGRAVLDLDARLLTEDDGSETPVTALEFQLLDAFLSRPNRVLSRDQLLDLAHDAEREPFDRSIDIRVARLRKKVEPDPARPTVIRTVRGVGYMYVP